MRDTIRRQQTLIPHLIPPHNPVATTKLIRTPEGLDRFVDAALEAGTVVLDTEATGLDPRKAGFVGISASLDGRTGYYIPIGHVDTCTPDYRLAQDQLPLNLVLDRFHHLLVERRVGTVWHNAKFDLKIFKVAGLDLPAPTWDSMVAAYYLRTGQIRVRLGLKWQSQHVLGIVMQDIDQLIGAGGGITFAEVPIEAAAEYAAADAAITHLLWQRQIPQIAAMDLYEGVWDNEMELTKVTAQMELDGVPADRDFFERYSEALADHLDWVQARVEDRFGQININSDDQLRDLLERAGYDLSDLSRTDKTNKPQVNEDNLNLLRTQFDDGLIDLVLEYKMVDKLRGTYTTNIAESIDEDGRSRTGMNQVGTHSGRYASGGAYNAQNVPGVTKGWRMEIRKGLTTRNLPGRWLFLAADYSQIELRTMAHISQDPTMIAVYQAGQDLHRLTTAQVLDIPEEEVTKPLRQLGKTLNFATIYQGGAWILANTLNGDKNITDVFGTFTVDQAEELLAKFYATYPGVKRYNEAVGRIARKRLWVRTLFGLRRSFPRLADDYNRLSDEQKRGYRHDLKSAGNHPIQGTVAGMMRIAMVRSARDICPKYNAQLIMQIHDENIYLVPEDNLDAFQAELLPMMESIYPMRVPVVAEADVADTFWGLKKTSEESPIHRLGDGEEMEAFNQHRADFIARHTP